MTNKSKFEFDIVLKSSAGKLWRNLKNFVTTFPKALPHMYKSIEIIEGDGKSVGSVFKSTNFKPGPPTRSLKNANTFSIEFLFVACYLNVRRWHTRTVEYLNCEHLRCLIGLNVPPNHLLDRTEEIPAVTLASIFPFGPDDDMPRNRPDLFNLLKPIEVNTKKMTRDEDVAESRHQRKRSVTPQESLSQNPHSADTVTVSASVSTDPCPGYSNSHSGHSASSAISGHGYSGSQRYLAHGVETGVILALFLDVKIRSFHAVYQRIAVPIFRVSEDHPR